MDTEKNLGDLASKILFLTVQCKRYGNVRTANVELNTNANQSLFKTNKKLLASPELNAIVKRDAEVKDTVGKFLLPFKMGVAVLPVASRNTVRDILAAYRDTERPELVKAFLDAYANRIVEAQVQLKDQFNPGQYLTKEQAANEFEFGFYIWSLTLPDDLKDEAHNTILQAADSIAEALTFAAHEAVSKLADSLSANSDGTAKKIYSTHFTKLQEFLAGFDLRNVTSNNELKAEMDKLKALMDGVDPEKVRENDGLRADIHKKLSDATATITVMVQPKGRKFRSEAE
jgi:hypothetical protein